MIIANNKTQTAKTDLHGAAGRAEARKAAESGKYPMGVYVEISRGRWERHFLGSYNAGNPGDIGFCDAFVG